MKFISCMQPAILLGIQYTQFIIYEIPGHTAGSHVSITCQICTLYSKIPRYGVTFAHMLTYLSNPTHTNLTLSPSSKMASSKEKKSSKLLNTPVPIVREKELLLVNECTDHLSQFGLTLWVVSMNQMPKNCDLLNQISTWHARQKNKF